MAELSSSNRDCRAEKIYSLALYRKSLLILALMAFFFKKTQKNKKTNSTLSLLLLWSALQFSCSLEVCQAPLSVADKSLEELSFYIFAPAHTWPRAHIWLQLLYLWAAWGDPHGTAAPAQVPMVLPSILIQVGLWTF